MSERAKRKHDAAVLDEQIRLARDRQRNDSSVEQALVNAQRALQETPRVLIPCELTLEYANISLCVERGECSECGQTIMGYEQAWRFCPVCGSEIKAVNREETADVRLTRNAIRNSLAGMTLLPT